jgi:hypothetical protein
VGGEAGQLSTAAPDAKAAYFVKFGGTRVWARNETECRRGIAQLTTAIENALGCQFTLDRKGIRYVTGESLGAVLDQKVVNAVFGEALRLGNAVEVVCISTTGKMFRAYIGTKRLPEWRERVAQVRQFLFAHKRVTISTIREEFYGSEKGAWTQASHIAGNMVYHGTAIYDGRFHVLWPEGLENGFR